MGIISNDDYVQQIENSVTVARMNPIWRREYMTLEEMLRIEREEGIEKGITEGIEIGIEKGRA